MFLIRTIVGGAFIASLSACTGPSPVPVARAMVYYDRAAFVETLKHDMPAVTGDVVQHGRCEVFVTTPENNVGSQKPCVFALTRDTVYVASWNAFGTKYENLMTIPLKGVDQVAYTAFGGMRQVQLTEKKRLLGLAVFNDEATANPEKETKQAFESIKDAGVPEGKSIRGVIFSNALYYSTYSPIYINTRK
ncbi:hypothetical protein [Pandoraea pnomenusa]|uniref:hypothetical protein n=1 Tax=Pandoraea pnomenusa TaxID=93220 RepID=UPI003340E93F